jgi:hypothetical protein
MWSSSGSSSSACKTQRIKRLSACGPHGVALAVKAAADAELGNDIETLF